MLEFFIALGGAVMTVWLLTRKCRFEEDLPDQIERKSFGLLEVLEDENAYLVRIEIDGQQQWGKIPRNRTKIHYLEEQTQYQRFDILETTFYYVEKSWLRMEQRGYRVEVSYVICASKVSKLSKKF